VNGYDLTQESAVRRAFGAYLMYSVIALLVVSAGAVFLSGTLARHQAERDAERIARAVATGIVAPLTTPAFHDHDPEAMSLFNRTMELRTLDGSIEHVKIWGDAGGGSGTILWSSEKPLVGKTFHMEPEEYALFGSDHVLSHVSDLTKAENELERTSADQLVEVYAGVPSVEGQDLLFEAYTSTAGLAESTNALILEIVPLPLTALLVFMLLTLPLAVSLARRVDAGQLQMRRMLVNAVASSDHERRRIAQDLHDGVLQDLAGVGYALSSDARQLDEDSEVRGHLDQASSILREDVSSLRHLMDDIYPPDVEVRGLSQAVRDLVDVLDMTDVSVTVEIDDSLAPNLLTARLAVRVTRELLRNVAKHADADQVVVRMNQTRQSLVIEVADNGVGFDPTLNGVEGHFGLRLIQETVADAGGHMTIDSAPGQGTTITAQLPA
jgi:two-component system NarL family sensor kinase